MAEVGKILLMLIVTIAVRQIRKLGKSLGIEEGSVSGDCKNDFMNK